MSGFDTESDGITAAAAELRGAVDSLTNTMSTVDSSVAANVGPGRLGAAAVGLIEAARRDLGGALGAVTDDAGRLDAALAGYTDLDERAAANLRRTAGG